MKLYEVSQVVLGYCHVLVKEEYKYAPEPFRKQETSVHYYQCDSKPVSDHQIAVPIDFSTNRNIEFDMGRKTFLTTFARLDYNMLSAVMERCKELGWDKE